MLKTSISILLLTVFLTTHPARAAEDHYDLELALTDNGAPATTIVVAGDGSGAWGNVIRGEVRNSLGEPVARASVVLQGREVQTDSAGTFSIDVASGAASASVLIKKAGYRKVLLEPRRGALSVNLEPVEIKSLYMQTGHLRNKTTVYKNALSLLQETELNALTIDVKDDDGRVSGGLKPFIDELHAQGFYAIARIVTFKDNIAPRKHPELALIDKTTGKPWEDKKGTTYLNAYNRGAWDYVLGIAKTAVEAGFDEIQFDYVRFPTDGNRSIVAWPTEFTSQTRTAAIAGFLSEAHQRLGSMGAFIAADVFGITAFDSNDSGIGQRIEGVAPHLDYVCPMVYPSGYAKGTGGVKDPVAQPGAIVETSVRRYRLRASAVNQDLVIRPWLQAFRDYAYSHRDYTGDDIRAQIDASDKAGGSGYLLWNAASRYQKSGLKAKGSKRRAMP